MSEGDERHTAYMMGWRHGAGLLGYVGQTAHHVDYDDGFEHGCIARREATKASAKWCGATMEQV